MNYFLCIALFLFLNPVNMLARTSPSKVIDISAASFQLDAETHLLRATGPVVVKQQSVTVTGDNALYDEKREHVILTGSVQVVRGPLTITCAKVIMKGLENWISAQGSVSVLFQKNPSEDPLSGQAERVTYDTLKETLDVSGASEFRYGQDRIEGESLFVDLKSPRVIAKGNAKIVVSHQRLKAL